MNVSAGVLPISLELIQLLRVGQYLDVAMVALYAYEYFSTLSMEVALVWPGQWKPAKILFLFNRYFPLVDFALNFLRDNGTHLAKRCPAILNVHIWFFMIGVFSVELVFTLRTWVVWGRNKFVIAGMAAWSLGSFIFVVVTYQTAFSSLQFHDIQPLTGCLTDFDASSTYYKTAMTILIYDIALVILTVIPFIKEYRQLGNTFFTKTSLFRVIYTEGIIFYIFQIITSIIVIILAYLYPEYPLIGLYVFRVIRAILSNRVVLHIRRVFENRIIDSDIS